MHSVDPLHSSHNRWIWLQRTTTGDTKSFYSTLTRLQATRCYKWRLKWPLAVIAGSSKSAEWSNSSSWCRTKVGLRRQILRFWSRRTSRRSKRRYWQTWALVRAAGRAAVDLICASFAMKTGTPQVSSQSLMSKSTSFSHFEVRGKKEVASSVQCVRLSFFYALLLNSNY